jgi:hypothetical protein
MLTTNENAMKAHQTEHEKSAKISISHKGQGKYSMTCYFSARREVAVFFPLGGVSYLFIIANILQINVLDFVGDVCRAFM